MANIKQVAAHAELSVSCVSKYLKNPNSVLESSRQRIEAAIAELHYVPSSVARNLRTQRTGIIKIISHSIRNPFCAELFELLRKFLEDSGYIAMLQLVEPTGPVDFTKKDLEQADGIILSCVENDEVFTALSGILPPDYPIVCLHYQKPAIDMPTVIIDTYNGMRLVANYLISIGCANLAYVGGPPHSPMSIFKFSGFSAAIADAKEKVTCAGIVNNTDRLSDLESGYRAAKELLRYSEIPDGIVCETDTVAAGVIQGLVKHNIRIPDQVHVTGCDNTIVAETVFPQLTSLGLPTDRVCEVTCQKLLARIDRDGESGDDGMDVSFTPKLVIRNS